MGMDFDSSSCFFVNLCWLHPAVMIDGWAPDCIFAKNQHFLISMKRNKTKTTDQIEAIKIELKMN